MSVINNTKTKEDQAMKKVSLLLILVMSVLMLKARTEATSYVTVEGKTYFCETVKPGLKYMNLKMIDGTVMKVPIKKVVSYSTNGHLYEKLPVMCEGAPENCTAMMEYITSRNGFRLYKYCKMKAYGELYDNTYENTHMEFTFFVFKDGKYHMSVTRENAESVLPFFGIQVIA
jgi:hypothetical protein